VHWNSGPDSCPGTRCGTDFDAAAALLSQFPDLIEAKVTIRAAAGKSDAVIEHGYLYLVIQAANFKANLVCPGMFAHVVQRLANDADHGAFHVGGELDSRNFGYVELKCR
jgi:hypothetical protein